MRKWWIGGGKTITGLHFEKKVDFLTLMSQMKNYEIRNNFEIFYLWKKVAETYKKHELYRKLLEPNGVKYLNLISKKLLPDNAVYVILKETLFIIEIKYQEVAWSVDEKLQTCDFKKKQYTRLLTPLRLNVEYCYILSEWFMKKEYKDVLNYIQSVWCKYFFETLPLDYLWLPIPEND